MIETIITVVWNYISSIWSIARMTFSNLPSQLMADCFSLLCVIFLISIVDSIPNMLNRSREKKKEKKEEKDKKEPEFEYILVKKQI